MPQTTPSASHVVTDVTLGLAQCFYPRFYRWGSSGIVKGDQGTCLRSQSQEGVELGFQPRQYSVDTFSLQHSVRTKFTYAENLKEVYSKQLCPPLRFCSYHFATFISLVSLHPPSHQPIFFLTHFKIADTSTLHS